MSIDDLYEEIRRTQATSEVLITAFTKEELEIPHEPRCHTAQGQASLQRVF
jgi:hypothetical protein